MQRRSNPVPQGMVQRAPESAPKAEEEKPGNRRCPVCGGWADAFLSKDAAYRAYIKCRSGDWGFVLLEGYSSIDVDEPCQQGHLAWQVRKVGRVEYLVCCFLVLRSGGLVGYCGRRRRRGELQGFLNPDCAKAGYCETKDALLLGVYLLGEAGGTRGELLVASGLNVERLDGAIRRNVKAGYLDQSQGKEQIPLYPGKRGYRYRLSWVGLSYLYLKFGHESLQQWVATLAGNGVSHESFESLESWPAEAASIS